ncbi:hypothetical protein AMS68_000588 [Peltaster fructicola]|uniref:NADAR domain-containing protein n=1 Tax=Peltaster fructicola TaxID=286661 RepID=A0A6H0XKB2_9PEZI|nr:hypothetical protein AMS68_000588 [Peltaster fructicola]
MADAKISADTALGPVFFWKPHEDPFGFLSQWYSCPFEVEGVVYASTEMWMMIQKARLFGDEEVAQRMMQTTDPAEHQKLGRQAKGFDRAKWDQHKSRIVEEGNYHKFSKAENSTAMAEKLLATGDRELASPADRIWGVGYGAADAEAHRAQWGENRMGLAMTAVRSRLRKERNAS